MILEFYHWKYMKGISSCVEQHFTILSIYCCLDEQQEWLFMACILYANILSREPLKGWNNHDNFLYKLDLFKDELSSIVKIWRVRLTYIFIPVSLD